MSETNKKNEPSKIILHCSDTEDSGDRFGVDDIRRWHTKDRGFLDVGYHYVIRRSGKIEIGRSENQVGAHCQGHNQDTIGICLIGTRKFTVMQYEALVTLVKTIKERHRIFIDDIYGHYEFNEGKTCPGVDMNLMRAFLGVKLLDRSIFKI